MLKASLFSSSGPGNLPSLHQDLVARGWAADRQFAEALAIGQLAPGPTGLWTVALGYLVYGLEGALLAAVAITLPPLLILPLARLHGRLESSAAMVGFVRGFGLAVAGSVPVILLRVAGSYGYDAGAVLLLLGSFAALLSRRLPPVTVLAIGASAGILLYR